MNWVVPGKFLAFSCPDTKDGRGLGCLTPAEYASIFRKLGVTAVVHLNKQSYDRAPFTAAGIRHVDMYFPDGSCPTRALVHKFLAFAEEHRTGAIAVHCKAGLGRTGTLIGCYAIKNYG